jgi:hypothetical protein
LPEAKNRQDFTSRKPTVDQPQLWQAENFKGVDNPWFTSLIHPSFNIDMLFFRENVPVRSDFREFCVRWRRKSIGGQHIWQDLAHSGIGLK